MGSPWTPQDQPRDHHGQTPHGNSGSGVPWADPSAGGHRPPAYGTYPTHPYTGAPGYAPGYAGHGWDDAPFGREPATGMPYSDKSKVAAGLLQIFLGTFGVGRFYMGHVAIGAVQLALTVLGYLTLLFVVGAVILVGVAFWALLDGIVILAGRPVDAHGRPLRP